MLREKSDYEDFYVPDRHETLDTIEKVEMFLEDVRIYLEGKNILE